MRYPRTLAVLAVATIGLTGCSVATNPDQAGLEYDAGPIANTEFSNCIAPSSREYRGFADRQFLYPAGQRTFDFGSAEGADAGPLALVAGGTGEGGADSTVELTVDGTLTFELATDCETLQAFHEQIGLKYEPSNDGLRDWTGLLDVYLGGPLQRALTEASQGVDWKTIYADAAVRRTVEQRVNELLPTYVEQLAGGPYFNGFSVSLQRPTLPADLQDALRQTQVAIEQNNAQQQRNVQVQSELEAIRSLVEVLGPDGYNTYQAIKDGKIQVFPLPQGSALNVTPGQVPAPAATEGS